MSTLLVILIVAAAIAALVSLIRGIIAFLQTSHADVQSGATGPSVSSQKQNKAMFARLMFQALAVVLCVLLLLLKR